MAVSGASGSGCGPGPRARSSCWCSWLGGRLSPDICHRTNNEGSGGGAYLRSFEAGVRDWGSGRRNFLPLPAAAVTGLAGAAPGIVATRKEGACVTGAHFSEYLWLMTGTERREYFFNQMSSCFAWALCQIPANGGLENAIPPPPSEVALTPSHSRGSRYLNWGYFLQKNRNSESETTRCTRGRSTASTWEKGFQEELNPSLNTRGWGLPLQRHRCDCPFSTERCSFHS